MKSKFLLLAFIVLVLVGKSFSQELSPDNLFRILSVRRYQDITNVLKKINPNWYYGGEDQKNNSLWWSTPLHSGKNGQEEMLSLYPEARVIKYIFNGDIPLKSAYAFIERNKMKMIFIEDQPKVRGVSKTYKNETYGIEIFIRKTGEGNYLNIMYVP